MDGESFMILSKPTSGIGTGKGENLNDWPFKAIAYMKSTWLPQVGFFKGK